MMPGSRSFKREDEVDMSKSLQSATGWADLWAANQDIRDVRGGKVKLTFWAKELKLCRETQLVKYFTQKHKSLSFSSSTHGKNKQTNKKQNNQKERKKKKEKQTKPGVAALRTPGRQSQAGLWGLLTTPHFTKCENLSQKKKVNSTCRFSVGNIQAHTCTHTFMEIHTHTKNYQSKGHYKYD